jgi:hypothetical protein
VSSGKDFKGVVEMAVDDMSESNSVLSSSDEPLSLVEPRPFVETPTFAATTCIIEMLLLANVALIHT